MRHEETTFEGLRTSCRSRRRACDSIGQTVRSTTAIFGNSVPEWLPLASIGPGTGISRERGRMTSVHGSGADTHGAPVLEYARLPIAADRGVGWARTSRGWS